MKLKGILDFSLGNFLCLRGFAPMGILQANYLQMRELAEGGNQPNLNLSKVKGFPLRIPPLDEQAEIVKRVAGLLRFAGVVETHIERAGKGIMALGEALLTKAFRGELVPQDPNDEPAEKLLERIAEEKEKMHAKKKAAPKRGRNVGSYA